jgi:hypothetical protein
MQPGGSLKRARASPDINLAYRGRLAPEQVQILMSPIYGRRRLFPLDVQELRDLYPVPAARLPRPQIYVKEHLVPTEDLSFQPGLQNVLVA